MPLQAMVVGFEKKCLAQPEMDQGSFQDLSLDL